jgi:hypothetical protein
MTILAEMRFFGRVVVGEEETSKAKATALWLTDGLHPTHRKVRDGWGTRSFVARQEDMQPQDKSDGDVIGGRRRR